MKLSDIESRNYTLCRAYTWDNPEPFAFLLPTLDRDLLPSLARDYLQEVLPGRRCRVTYYRGNYVGEARRLFLEGRFAEEPHSSSLSELL